VAIKQYRDDEFGKNDCDKEMKNNTLYNHERVMALQAALHFRETYMHIYPLAQACLQDYLNEDPLTLYGRGSLDEGHDRDDQFRDKAARLILTEYQGLLSALDHIHRGNTKTLGYHFDLSKNHAAITLNSSHFDVDPRA
jgi:hypothetical protein